MTSEREWLRAETDGQDELAERRFAALAAQIPAIAPSDGFANRVAQTAWRARVRRRRFVRLTRVAAALLLTLTAVGSLYEMVASGLAVRTAVLLSHGVVWVLTSADQGARWWGIADSVGNAVGVSIGSPATGAVAVAIEIVMLLALCAFGRLFRNELQTRESRKV